MPDPRIVQVMGTLYRDTVTGQIGTKEVLQRAVYKESQEKKRVNDALRPLGEYLNQGFGVPRNSNIQNPAATSRGRVQTYNPQQPLSQSLAFREPTGLQPDFQDYIPNYPQLQFQQPNIDPNNEFLINQEIPMGPSTQQTQDFTQGLPTQQNQQELSVTSSLGRLPNSYEEIDAMYKSGQISQDQANQLELQVTNGPAGTEDGSIQDGNTLDQSGQQNQQGNIWGNLPPINFAGSDLSSELYMLGNAIGSQPGTRGRGATMVAAGGAALFDIARNVAAGIGYQKRNQYVNDYYNKQQRKRQYNPVSKTSNDNYSEGIPTHQDGGTFQQGQDGPVVSSRGMWDGKGDYRIPSNNITMEGVDFPVMATPNVGDPIMMQPGQNYTFPGASYVDETPAYQDGGTASSKYEEQLKAYKENLKGFNSPYNTRQLVDKNSNPDLYGPNPNGLLPKAVYQSSVSPSAYFFEFNEPTATTSQSQTPQPTTPKVGRYLDASTGRPLPIEEYGSPGQEDRQLMQYLDQVALKNKMLQQRGRVTASFQEGGTQQAQPLTKEQINEQALQLLIQNPMTDKKGEPLSLDKLRPIKGHGYPRMVGESITIPGVGTYGKDQYTVMETPEGYQGPTPYIINGKPVFVDEKFNKEFFQMYVDPKLGADEYFPIYSTRAYEKKFQDGGTFNGKKIGDEVEFEYDGEIVKGVIRKIENGKLYI